MAEIGESLTGIASISDQKQRIEQYKSLLQRLFVSADANGCKAIIEHLLTDDVPLVISRQLLQMFAQEVCKLPTDMHKTVAEYALEKLQPRVVSYEEAVTVIRENLAEVFQKDEEWTKAAQILAGIDLDSGQRPVDPGYRLAKAVKIAMLYLEDDDPVAAETYLKKAAALISNCKDEALELQYKVCYARILDSKRRFLEAAHRYYELSSMHGRRVAGQTVSDDDLMQALQSAITCTVLAAAGPQRSRMLATLYKDERTRALPVAPLLEKVYLERILRRSEVESFAATLKPHQMAELPDGSTVLDRSVMQHNLLAVSRLYSNIAISQLAELLGGIKPERAEALAADMIADKRLSASIDQVEGFLYFNDKEEVLLQWDSQIVGVCNQVNDIVDILAASGIKIAT